MQIEPPKSRLKLNTEFDRLSDLPSEVTEKILSDLPIKEAVRTSILSSKWRYKWATRPVLVFDELISFPESLNNHDKLVKIIDHVLLLHIGPIDKVKFSHSALKGTADVDKWILHLSRNSIKELTLRFRNTPEYKLPSTLFSFEDLVFLELYNCLMIKPPRTIMGFKSLKKLQLVCVTLTQDDFENLIVSCSVLEHLLMTNWRGLTKIKIDAPTIQILEICGLFEDLKIHNALKLERLYLEAYNNQRSQVPCGSSNLVKLFSQCANIQCVTLTNYVLEYLAAGDLPLKLPKPCMHLEVLYIQIRALDMKEISTFICLLRSAPALQRLYIALPKVRQPALVGEVNSWLEGTQNFELRKLRIVEVLYVSSAKAELDVIKFLLLNAPILERVAVNVESQSCFLEVSKTLNQFRRSSAQTEVVFFDP